MRFSSSGAVLQSPMAECLMRWLSILCLVGIVSQCGLIATPVAAADPSVLRINEIMASNSSSTKDPQGHYDDWIELHNQIGRASCRERV